ncbi:MAG: hypothetical protein A3J84_06245 [Ignavibacteria bacterium RIFOXYA2_FULL_37_17]|nr:MAG: hypothetical protein A3J84_06245 [Ignavibacteria bacterium RIFOXYA2_FULL_37_17]
MSIKKTRLSIILFILVISGCGSVKETTSVWKDNEIKIDGDISDWQNALISIPDKKFAVGFKNDDKFLYISLITDDRMKIMQMLREGFITWVTPNEGDGKTFGVKFPLSNKDMEGEQLQSMNREPFQRDNRDNMEKQFVRLLNRQNELEIINKDKFPLSLMPLENKEGIKVKLGYTANNFVYELQIPLTTGENYSFPVNAAPGGKVSIRFETEKMDLENSRGAMREGGAAPRSGGQMPGGQRGAGRMGQGMPGLQNSEPINYSFDVILQLPAK